MENYVGQRVRCIKGYRIQSMIGKLGTIIFMDEEYALVEFDEEFVGGHDGENVEVDVVGKDGHCWWFPSGKDLTCEHLEDEKPFNYLT